MDQEELLRKVTQIEAQAKDILEDYPRNLTKERVRMILALARYIRMDLDRAPLGGALGDEQAPASDGDDTVPRGA